MAPTADYIVSTTQAPILVYFQAGEETNGAGPTAKLLAVPN
jgi:hypothetical protein